MGAQVDIICKFIQVFPLCMNNSWYKRTVHRKALVQEVDLKRLMFVLFYYVRFALCSCFLFTIANHGTEDKIDYYCIKIK